MLLARWPGLLIFLFYFSCSTALAYNFAYTLLTSLYSIFLIISIYACLLFSLILLNPLMPTILAYSNFIQALFQYFTCECVGGSTNRNRTLPKVSIEVVRQCILTCGTFRQLLDSLERPIIIWVCRASVLFKVGKASCYLSFFFKEKGNENRNSQHQSWLHLRSNLINMRFQGFNVYNTILRECTSPDGYTCDWIRCRRSKAQERDE